MMKIRKIWMRELRVRYICVNQKCSRKYARNTYDQGSLEKACKMMSPKWRHKSSIPKGSVLYTMYESRYEIF